MRKFTSWQTSRLLRKFASEARKTAKRGDQDAIHDLRVAIRRFLAGLRLFRQFYPDRARKELNQALKSVMNAAGEVRDRDIAMKFLAQAGIADNSAPVRQLRAQRVRAAAALQDALKDWKARGVSREWRRKLEI